MSWLSRVMSMFGRQPGTDLHTITMALQRPISTALACRNCQRLVLRSFIAGVTNHLDTPSRPFPYQRRTISQNRTSLSDERQRVWKTQLKEDLPLNDINETIERFSAHDSDLEPPIDSSTTEQPQDAFTAQEQQEQSQEPEKQQSHIPWYLQAQPTTTQQADHPLAARQRLPELPSNPPTILQPLLQHVSVELGIDDLTILDLRSIDPPPALGANLFMIIGTARSEKHLHVSADRLCRWLRTTYKIHPYADGLLGRNELKLKLRRKAKRSRLLSAVGTKTTSDTDVDDGIRTGWVCVNVGRVEGGEPAKTEEQIAREEAIVGFGSQTTGSNVVVQMLTEEKRGEIDLENLWTEVLGRAEKQRVKAIEGESGDELVEGGERSTAAAGNGEASPPRTPAAGSSNAYHPSTYASSPDAAVQLNG